MAVKKLSEIALAGAPPALTDTVIGVGAGTTDLQYTIAQLRSSIVALTVGTTAISGGTTGRVLYDNAGVLGEYTNAQLTALINPVTALLSGAIPAFPNNTTTFFRGDGTYAALPSSFSGLANPTASVGPTAVNGTATTAMRSDAAPPLDQTAAYAFSGLAATTISQAASGAVPLTISGYSLTGSQNQSGLSFAGTLNTSGSPDVIKIAITDTARGAATKLFNIYAGSAGATSEFSIDRGGGVVQAGNLTVNGGTITLSNGAQISANGSGQFLTNTSRNVAFFTSAGGIDLVSIGNASAIGWSSGATPTTTWQTPLTSPATATVQLGLANAASPVAQTLQVQNAATGNNNGAATFTHVASLSVGNGTSGDHVFSTGKNGNGSGVLATATTALTIKGETQTVVVAAGKQLQLGNAAVTGLVAGALAALTNATISFTDSTGTVYRVPAITP